MGERNYTKRETDEYRSHMMEQMNAQSSMLQKILDNQELQKERVDKHDFWINAVKWGAGVFLALLVPLTYVIKILIDNEASKIITQTFSNYNIVVK